MNTLSATKPVLASKKRLLLAIFLDYLLYGATWEIVWYFIGPELSNWILEISIFSLVESVLLWRYNTPGIHFLSITTKPSIRTHDGISNRLFGRLFYVDSVIFSAERWFTLTIGILFILDGSKSLARWTAYGPPLPFFGIETTILTHAAFAIPFGILSMLVGYLMLKLRRAAFPFGISALILEGLSIIMSWDMWDDKVIEMITSRREYLGRPVKPGEIEIMQALVPEVFLIMLCLMLVVLPFMRKHLFK